MKKCHVVLPLLLLAVTSSTSMAATYSARIDTLVGDASGEFSRGEFDFGVTFARIDDVRVEITMPEGLSGGICSGLTCLFSSVDLALHDAGHFVDFSVLPPSNSVSFDPEVLRTTFHQVLTDRPSETRLLPPNPSYDFEAGEFLSDPWPGFLLAGKGVVDLQQVDSQTCRFNCSGSSATFTTRIPAGVASVRLVVEGVAIPEPRSALLVGVGLAVGAVYAGGSGRRR